VEVEVIELTLPVCDSCFAETEPRTGLAGFLFPEWHEIGETVRGTPVFSNEAFQAAFERENPHLHGGPRLKLPPMWHL